MHWEGLTDRDCIVDDAAAAALHSNSAASAPWPRPRLLQQQQLLLPRQRRRHTAIASNNHHFWYCRRMRFICLGPYSPHFGPSPPARQTRTDIFMVRRERKNNYSFMTAENCVHYRICFVFFLKTPDKDDLFPAFRKGTRDSPHLSR